MNGVSTHTHDPISRGEFTEVVALRNCELCNNNFWEDSLNPFQDYERVCETCIALTEQEDKENNDFANGRASMAQEILQNVSESISKTDLIKLISRLQA